MPKIREASFDDFENIMFLQKRYNIHTKSYEEWQHIWRNNPLITDIKEPWPIGWVLEDKGRITGYLGNVPMLYEFKGEQLIAATIAPFVADVDYRNHSIPLLNRYLMQKNVSLFQNLTSNHKMGIIFSAFKAKRMPLDSYDIVLFLILNYKEFISSSLLKRRIPLSCILKYPLALAMEGAEKIINREHNINLLNEGLKCCTAFDERFDVFWNRLKERYRNRLLCVRSKRYLDWYFKYAIAQGKIKIFFIEKNSQIISYAIFVREDDPESGSRRVKLIDLQSIDENRATLMTLVLAGIKKYQEENVHALEIIGFNSQKRNILDKYSLYKRKMPTWPLFYKTDDVFLAKQLSDHKVWDICPLDSYVYL